MSRTLHKRFAVALLREALAGAGTLHLDYRIDHEREVIHGWEPRRSANDPALPPPLDPEADPARQLGQGILSAALDAADMVPFSTEIGTEPDFLDLYFEPDPSGVPAPGLLGEITQAPCIFAPFPQVPDKSEARTSVRLGLALWSMQDREATRAHTPSPEMPPSWLISNDLSEMLIRGFGLDPGQPSGLYVSSPVIAMNAIVLSELPRTRATLLLRLLGTGTLLEEALAEQAALPADSRERRAARAALLAVTAEPVPIGEMRKSPVLQACRRSYETWAKAIEG
jgi:hypothetical protein